jgi:hypothetical protein
MAKAKTADNTTTAPETTVENTVETTVPQEVPLNPETEVVPDVTPAGHGSRDFHSPV